MRESKETHPGAGHPGRKHEIASELSRERSEIPALETNEGFFRSIVEAANDFIFAVDPELTIVYLNPAAGDYGARVFGCAPTDFHGINVIDVMSITGMADDEEAARNVDNLRGIFTSKEPVYIEKKLLIPEGVLWVGVWLLPLKDEAGEVTHALGICRDVTARREAEERLRRSEEHLRAVVVQQEEAREALANEKELLAATLAAVDDAVITTDTMGRVVNLNRVAQKLTGWDAPEAVGRPIGMVFHVVEEKTREYRGNPVQQLLATGQDVSPTAGDVDQILMARNGSETLISYSCAPIHRSEGEVIGVVLVFRDVGHQRAVEEEMHRLEKLESVGLLAGGIAHDFNNILTSVMGNLSLAQRRASGNEFVTARLEDAEKAVTRARDLTNQLLTFSKGGAPIKTLASARTIIEDSAEFALSGSSTDCIISIPDDLWAVEVDQGQISQVIHNLVINADQAMSSGGRVVISAANIEIHASDGLPVEPGEYVRISVQDNGIGIPGEDLDQVFDPYFTTKEGGTGLGLATTYSIMRRHGGHVTVESVVNQGTTFHLFLPASKKTPSDSLAAAPRLISGQGRILVMDDEPNVRRLTKDILHEIGFEVELATSGEEALELYSKRLNEGSRFDAVIMDLTIPGGMGGKEAVWLLKDIDPDAKAIVSSGYSNDPVMSEFREHGFSGRITKPYGVDQLAAVMDGVFNHA